MNGSPPRESALPESDRSGLAQRHARLLARIDEACCRAGRPAGSVGLLAVSKTFSAEHVLALLALGQRAFGENYVQEALGKIEACRRTLGRGAGELLAPQWHFIGPIQSNKTRTIAEHFDWVHSVDREKIATRLGEQRPAALPPLQCCVQVNVSGEASKSGCTPAAAPAVARAIAEQPRLRLRGVMVIPEPSSDEALQRRRFASAREVLAQLREQLVNTWASSGSSGRDLAPGGQDHARGSRDLASGDRDRDPAGHDLAPGGGAHALSAIDTLSMGMSDDLEAAIAEGATIVRVGSALFGARPRK